MEGTYSSANLYKCGDSFYLITRYRMNAPQNDVLEAASYGYGPSYDEYTQMGVVQVANQHADKPWVSVCAPFNSEDEFDGVKRIVDWANGTIAVKILEEAAGGVDLDENPVAVEALRAVEAAKEVDETTDPVVTDLDEPGGPEPTVDDNPDELTGNTDEPLTD